MGQVIGRVQRKSHNIAINQEDKLWCTAGTCLAKFEVGPLEAEFVDDGVQNQASDNLRRVSLAYGWGTPLRTYGP